MCGCGCVGVGVGVCVHTRVFLIERKIENKYCSAIEALFETKFCSSNFVIILGRYDLRAIETLTTDVWAPKHGQHNHICQIPGPRGKGNLI